MCGVIVGLGLIVTCISLFAGIAGFLWRVLAVILSSISPLFSVFFVIFLFVKLGRFFFGDKSGRDAEDFDETDDRQEDTEEFDSSEEEQDEDQDWQYDEDQGQNQGEDSSWSWEEWNRARNEQASEEQERQEQERRQRERQFWSEHSSDGSGAGENSDEGSAAPSSSSISSRAEALRFLGLPSEVTAAEIKQRYHDLVKKYHPDRLGPKATAAERRSAETYFRKILEAYEYLSR